MSLHHVNAGAIAGGVVGGVVGLLALVVLWRVLVRKKRAKRVGEEEGGGEEEGEGKEGRGMVGMMGRLKGRFGKGKDGEEGVGVERSEV